MTKRAKKSKRSAKRSKSASLLRSLAEQLISEIDRRDDLLEINHVSKMKELSKKYGTSEAEKRKFGF